MMLLFHFLFHLSLSAFGKSSGEQENRLNKPNALTPLLKKQTDKQQKPRDLATSQHFWVLDLEHFKVGDRVRVRLRNTGKVLVAAVGSSG